MTTCACSRPILAKLCHKDIYERLDGLEEVCCLEADCCRVAVVSNLHSTATLAALLTLSESISGVAVSDIQVWCGMNVAAGYYIKI